MSDSSETNIQQLRREVEKLQRTLEEREQHLARLGEELSEVNTGLMALIDENFDGNVYRKALEYGFKDYVYTKIRNLFGTIAIIAGVGGFFFVNASIDRVVKNTIDKQHVSHVGLVSVEHGAYEAPE